MIRYQKLDPQMPDLIRGSSQAAGIDLYNAGHAFTLEPGQSTVVDNGVIVEIPEGTYGQVTVRSGLGFKSGAVAHVGIIDSDYRGEVKTKLFNLGTGSLYIGRWDRVSQLVITPCLKLDPLCVENLSVTERGDKGFGSTGS